VLGGGGAIQLAPPGSLPAGKAVIASADHKDTAQSVRDFTMALAGQASSIPPAQRQKLPAGQGVISVEAPGLAKVSRRLAVQSQPTFAIGFPPGTPSQYILESDGPIQLHAQGAGTANVRVIVSAFHKNTRQIVQPFTFVLDEAP